MNVLSNALEIMQKAEKSVAELAQKALEQRDYSTASCLMNLASELNDIAAKLSPILHSITECSSSINDRTVGTVLFQADQGRDRIRPMRRSPKKGEFPKFQRNENMLYKLGWSKAEKSIYEHKAPKNVLTALVNKLMVIGANRQRFTMDNVLPLTTLNEDTELPAYQVYICLAWLRITKLLIQHGRQGYSISHPMRFESDVEKSWQKIPLKQGARP
jgi:hypothetical protein